MAVTLAALAVMGLVWLLRRTGSRDAPARIAADVPARLAAVAANRLPAHRQDWGMAMAAELTQVSGRARRWQFAAGLLRVMLFPPSRHPARVPAAALGGLLAAVGATVAAATEVPSMSVFAAAAGLLLGGYATVAASRSHRLRPTVPRIAVGAVALAGVAAAVAAVVRIAVAYPAATTDRTHVFSVLFALALTGCVALALSPVGRAGSMDPSAPADTVLWWAFAGALASGAGWAAVAVTTPVITDGTSAILWPVGAAATLAVSAGAAATTRSRLAGVQAGLLTAVLSALMRFALDLTAILQVHHYTLTSPYDIAAYAHSGYPSVASYVLSDALGGSILGGLVLYPIGLIGIAHLAATAGAGLRQLAARRTTA
jgi:hypothetical protein